LYAHTELWMEKKQDWSEIIANNELTLGEQCYPCTIKKFKVLECELTSHNATIYGRKIPLLDIRQKLLEKHKQCMYLHSDDQLTTFTDEELLHQLAKENTDT